jgi:hypothetical protein
MERTDETAKILHEIRDDARKHASEVAVQFESSSVRRGVGPSHQVVPRKVAGPEAKWSKRWRSEPR